LRMPRFAYHREACLLVGGLGRVVADKDTDLSDRGAALPPAIKNRVEHLTDQALATVLRQHSNGLDDPGTRLSIDQHVPARKYAPPGGEEAFLRPAELNCYFSDALAHDRT